MNIEKKTVTVQQPVEVECIVLTLEQYEAKLILALLGACARNGNSDQAGALAHSIYSKMRLELTPSVLPVFVEGTPALVFNANALKHLKREF